MPNVIKYSESTETQALRSGNFYLGVGDVGKGPTESSGYWNGISPPVSGYTVYLNKATQGPSIYTPNNDSDLITITNMIGGTSFTSVTQCFNWYNTQNDKMVVNKDYPAIVTDGLVLNLDASFRPSYSGSGTTWYDTSISGNTGTLINGPTYNSGGWIVFDGTNDYVLSGLDCNKTNYSVDWWIYPSNTSNFNQFISFNRADWGAFGCHTTSTGQVYVGTTAINNTGRIIPWRTGVYVANVWQNFTWTFANGAASFYRNGQLEATGSLTLSSDASFTSVYIGTPNSNTINGRVANLKVYSNKVLSQQEIKQNFYGGNIVTSGLVLYLDAANLASYPQSGTTWYDISGSGNTGTLVNGPTFNSLYGGSIVFDGTNDYCVTNSSTTLNMNNGSFTIDVWIKITNFNANERMIAEYSVWSQAGTYQLTTFGNEIVSTFPNANAAGKSARYTYSQLTSNVWTHIIGQHNTITNELKIYVNGINLGTTTGVTQEIGSQNTNLYIASRGGTQLFLPCTIGSLRIYNKALTAQEVSQNYNAQKSRFGL